MPLVRQQSPDPTTFPRESQPANPKVVKLGWELPPEGIGSHGRLTTERFRRSAQRAEVIKKTSDPKRELLFRMHWLLTNYSL